MMTSNTGAASRHAPRNTPSPAREALATIPATVTRATVHGRERRRVFWRGAVRLLGVSLIAALPGLAQAQDFALKMSLDYGDADGPLRLNGASTSFGFGALIPQVVSYLGPFGELGVGYGYGYGPNQTATLGPVAGKGDLESTVLQLNYAKDFELSDDWAIGVFAERRDYEVSGTLQGRFGEDSAPIRVRSDIIFEEIGLQLSYRAAQDLRFYVGVSSLDWDVDSNARATVNQSITAEVDVDGNDTTTQLKLGLDTRLWDFPVAFELRSADLEADETVNKLEVRVTATLAEF